MKQLFTILLTILSFTAIAQPVQIGSSDSTKTNLIKGSLQVNKNLTVKSLAINDTTYYLSVDSTGKFILRQVIATGGGANYLAGYGLIKQVNTFLVDTSVIPNYRILGTIINDSNNLLRDYIATNYYHKDQSDARYLQEEVDGDTTNELQTLLLGVDDSLAISNGNKVKLPYLKVETDPEWNGDKGNYYDKTQVDSIATGKSDTGHAHTFQDVTDAGNATTNKITVLDVDFDTIPGYSAARAAVNHFAGNDSVTIGFCAIKFTVDGSGNVTPYILDDPEHSPVRFSGVSYGAGPILTLYFTPTASQIKYSSVTPDETWANYGMTAGASAHLDKLLIEASWDKGNWAGLMFRDSTNTWRFSPNIANSTVTETGSNTIAWEESSSFQMGGRLPPIGEYQGMSSSGYEIIYAGPNGYRVVKSQNYPYYLQKQFNIVDAYNNPVPFNSLTHLDMFMVNSNRAFRLNPQWNYNIWGNFNSSSNLWVTVVYENIGLWLLLLGVPFRIRRTKRGFRVELIKMFRA